MFAAEVADRGARFRAVSPTELVDALSDEIAAAISFGLTDDLGATLPWAPRPHFADGDQPETMLARGLLGIAASGSILVSEPRHDRLRIFLARRLILLLPAAGIVAGVRDAAPVLRGLAAAGRFATFVTGPSRTSDIEQISIIGAHGPGDLAVFVVEDWRPDGG